VQDNPRLYNPNKILRAVPGKKVLGVGTELENGGTTNTTVSFFMVQSIWIFQETPHPPPFN